MKRVLLVATLTFAALAFVLAGCSGGTQAAKNINADDLKGYWALDSGSNVGIDVYLYFEDTADEADETATNEEESSDEGESSSEGENSESTTEDDDSGKYFQMHLADSFLSGSWSVSGSEATLKVNDSSAIAQGDDSEEAEKTVTLTYDGSKLTLGSDAASKLVFVKDDSDKVKEAFGIYEKKIEPMSEVSIANDDKLDIKVQGKGNNENGEKGYEVAISNKTDKSVYLECEDDFKVDGETTYGYLYLDEYVGQGKTATGFLAAENTSGEVGETTGTIVAYDAEAMDAIYNDFYSKQSADEETEESAEAENADEGEAAAEAEDTNADTSDEPDLSSAVIGRYTISIK